MSTPLPGSLSMGHPYLADLSRLVLPHLRASDDVVFKHFFSGGAAYASGTLFATLTPVGLAFKLPEVVCVHLLISDAVPLRYFPKSPIKKSYALFPDPGSLASERVTTFVSQSIDYVTMSRSDPPI